ncbi:DUF3313 family protein [Caulobacter segnis]
MNRRLFTGLALAGLTLAGGGTALAEKPPAEWDGLVRIKARKFKLAYLLPGVDFRTYDKVMLDPTEIAFEKNWKRDYNMSSPAETLTDRDLQRIAEEGRAGAGAILAKAYAAGGYPVVAAPAPDVLRVRTALVNIEVTAPDLQSPGIVRTYARDAGVATLVVEARDSMTGALLGRAVDAQEAGDMPTGQRNRVTNRADFARIMEAWARNAVKGLDELKALSPINADQLSP